MLNKSYILLAEYFNILIIIDIYIFRIKVFQHELLLKIYNILSSLNQKTVKTYNLRKLDYNMTYYKYIDKISITLKT